MNASRHQATDQAHLALNFQHHLYRSAAASVVAAAANREATALTNEAVSLKTAAQPVSGGLAKLFKTVPEEHVRPPLRSTI
eukprot:CAMPEP_0183437130 /NCGR_PEP_ID=MMETSP0370-20130417/71717_1 /TAXON_ID=268820 /ORGANISM="Peridinium aciculiferum, Strain PAER-2" /LENGTH=80 /DNA_ID=CAMNT_0025624811 /DNA_START=10 /DNA_END=252 /DNA_ORIENTATION=-